MSPKYRVILAQKRARAATRGRDSAYGRRLSAKRLPDRVIDYRRYDKDGVPAEVVSIKYDPNRTARVALLKYADGERRYIIAPEGLEEGAAVSAGVGSEIRPGNNLPLRNIPVGTTVHAVELRPGGGGRLGRTAGAKIQLVAREGGIATLRLPGGEMRIVDARCRATVGELPLTEKTHSPWAGADPRRKGSRTSSVELGNSTREGPQELEEGLGPGAAAGSSEDVLRQLSAQRLLAPILERRAFKNLDEQGMSQTAIAEIAGVSQAHVSRTLATLRSMPQLTETTVSEIVWKRAAGQLSSKKMLKLLLAMPLTRGTFVEPDGYAPGSWDEIESLHDADFLSDQEYEQLGAGLTEAE